MTKAHLYRFVRRCLPIAFVVTVLGATGCGPGENGPAGSSEPVATEQSAAAIPFVPGWGDTAPQVWPLTDLNLPTTTGNNSAVAIPPNKAGCGPNGAVIVARGDSFRGALVTRNTLSCAENGTNCSTITRDLANVHVVPPGVIDRMMDTGKNDIARMPSGAIIVARMLIRHSPTLGSNQRGVMAFFSSVDCGNAWTEISQIDAFNVYPEYNFLEGALYADPWQPSRLFFVALDGLGGNNVFISNDGGYTWGPRRRKSGQNGPKITTFPNGRAYVLGITNNVAYVDHWDAVNGWSTAANNVATDVAGLDRDNDGISRVGTLPDGDYLRVIYPYKSGSGTHNYGVRQKTVKFAGTTMSVTRTKSLTASTPNGSIHAATFVETDRLEMPSSSMENAALLYWQEPPCTGSAANHMKIKAMGIRDYDSWTAPVELDSDSSSFDCWGGSNHQGALRGGFFFNERRRQLNFLTHWIEPSPKNGVAGMSTRFVSFPENNSQFESFAPFESLGTPGSVFAGPPAVSSWAPEHLDVFGVSGGALWHRFHDTNSVGGEWSPAWETVLPGALTVSASGVAAVSSQRGQVDVVAKGSDQGLSYARRIGSSWEGWVNLGRPSDGTLGFRGVPAITSWAPGRLDVFANTATQTYHRGCESSCMNASSWSNWSGMGTPSGGIDMGVAAVAPRSGHIDTFVVGSSTKAMFKRSFDVSSGWTGWASLGGIFRVGNVSANPAVTSWGPDHLDLFARASNGFIHHRALDAAYGGTFWLSSSGIDLSPGLGEVAVTSPGPNRIHKVVVGSDGAIWHAKTPFRRLQLEEVGQSSTVHGGGPTRAADNNTDGNYFNNSVTHTDFHFQPMWEGDLGTSGGYIAFIDVYNRTDCCADRLSNFNVSISENGTTWTSFNTPGQAGTPTSIPIYSRARYIRVQLLGSNFLSLAEVVLWGTQ